MTVLLRCRAKRAILLRQSCPSVRLSGTFVDSVKMAENIVNFYHHLGYVYVYVIHIACVQAG